MRGAHFLLKHRLATGRMQRLQLSIEGLPTGRDTRITLHCRDSSLSGGVRYANIFCINAHPYGRRTSKYVAPSR
jgi:hypothetical protein